MKSVAMKRSREDGKLETEDIANCLMLLSRVGKTTDHHVNRGSRTRAFVCKTCNKEFQSFQALGGHRASHKKPRLMAGDLLHSLLTSPLKPKTHECSVCGLDFPIGQALGGHMRRHRGAAVISKGGVVIKHAALQPVMKKSSGKRALFLDLNMTPLQGDDLKLCSW